MAKFPKIKIVPFIFASICLLFGVSIFFGFAINTYKEPRKVDISIVNDKDFSFKNRELVELTNGQYIYDTLQVVTVYDDTWHVSLYYSNSNMSPQNLGGMILVHHVYMDSRGVDFEDQRQKDEFAKNLFAKARDELEQIGNPVGEVLLKSLNRDAFIFQAQNFLMHALILTDLQKARLGSTIGAIIFFGLSFLLFFIALRPSKK